MQSQIILLSNVKQDNIARLVQKEFEMLGITGIKGKRIDAERAAIHKSVAESLSDYNVIMVIGGMGEKENNIYFEFIDFYNDTKINNIWFTEFL